MVKYPPSCQKPHLYSVKYTELPSQTQKSYGFTATGLSFDKKNNQFLIGNYGKSKKEDKEMYPGVISMDIEFSEIAGELYFDSGWGVDIQGIAYDEINDSIWYTNGNEIINCAKDNGEIISSFTIGNYGKYKANGICIDADNQSLWILCTYKYLLNFKKDGKLIRACECDYIGQDHICMDEKGDIYIYIYLPESIIKEIIILLYASVKIWSGNLYIV